jgi:hypothetical protein
MFSREILFANVFVNAVGICIVVLATCFGACIAQIDNVVEIQSNERSVATADICLESLIEPAAQSACCASNPIDEYELFQRICHTQKPFQLPMTRRAGSGGCGSDIPWHIHAYI